MPRKGPVARRQILPDPVYGSKLITRFINRLMLDGKKSTAEQIFYKALDILAEKTNEDPLRAFEKCLDNIRPALEVKSRRVGGSTYQVPVEVRQERGQALATRWLIGFAKSRPGRNMAEKLAAEMLACANGEGSTIKKREDTHKMAEANRAFSHYRW